MSDRWNIQAPQLTRYLIEALGLRGQLPLELSPEVVPVVVLGDISPGTAVQIQSVAEGVTIPVSLAGGEIAVRNPGSAAQTAPLMTINPRIPGQGSFPSTSRVQTWGSVYSAAANAVAAAGGQFNAFKISVNAAFYVRILSVTVCNLASSAAVMICQKAEFDEYAPSNVTPVAQQNRGNEVSAGDLTIQSLRVSGSVAAGLGWLHVMQAATSQVATWRPADLILREDDVFYVRNANTAQATFYTSVEFEIWNSQGENDGEREKPREVGSVGPEGRRVPSVDR